MVLTAAQTTAFFEGESQMIITHNTMVQLQSEGITDPDNLVDFNEDAMAMISQNLRRPGGRIQDPDPNATAGATIPTPPFIIGEKKSDPSHSSM